MKAAPTGKIHLLILSGLLSVCFLVSCHPVKKSSWRLRYRYPRRHPLIYRFFLEGKGEITLAPSEEGDGIKLPVSLQGGFDLRITSSSAPDSLTTLKLKPADFNLLISNNLRGEQLTVAVTDRVMEVRRGNQIVNTITADHPDFPLKDIIGEGISLTVDDRGKIEEAVFPPPPPQVPYLKFDELLRKTRPEFPGEEIKPGRSWTRALEGVMPPAGLPWAEGESWKLEMKYTFLGPNESGSPVMGLQVEGKTSQTARPGDGPRPVAGTRSLEQDISGRIDFDVEKGAIISSRLTISQRMEMLISVDEMEKGKSINLTAFFEMEITQLLRDEKTVNKTSGNMVY